MQKTPEESEKESLLLDVYSSFLDSIEILIQEQLPDTIRIKNISNYKMLIQGKGEEKFLEELFKKFEIVKHARGGFINDSVKEMKGKIRTGEVYLVPIFFTEKEGLPIESLFFVKKKDKLDLLKERVKKLLDSFVPEPEPGFHH